MRKIYGLLILFSVCSNLVLAQVTFVIESLPETTPANDSVFISGTFNNWNTNDPAYLLKKQPNGRLAITITVSEPVVEYKFTRGDWLKVETNKENKYIPNRLLRQNGTGEVVLIRIENWQDLGGARHFEYLIFYYFAMACLALLLVVLSIRIFKKEPAKRIIFAINNGLIGFLFFGVVIYYVVSPIWQAYMIIGGQAIIFAWGPWMYFFIKFIETKDYRPIPWTYFVPIFLALFLALFRLSNLDTIAFLSFYAGGLLTWGELLMLSFGGLVFVIFLFKLLSEQRKQLITFQNTRSVFAGIFLLINIVGLGLMILNLLMKYHTNGELIGYKAFFVVFSLLVWLEGIVLWQDPQFFKDKPQNLHIDSADQLLSKLRYSMETEKVYHEAELNVNRLAELIGTKPHILSKLLNEHYEQNFRDFVNAYRVEEFIRLANEGKLENLTYLGLAHEVGFNSKSTFNLAFKKITRRSPREYFKTLAL